MATAQKIYQLPALITQIASWRAQNNTIAFTNGCFDILHLGHIDYLEKVSELADKLIIGINTDSSIKRLKGINRPIIEAYARARVMAALEFVHAVILFDEDTPLELIKAIKPDILAKGSDYSIRNIVGADFVISYGGKVETIDLVQGYSTSSIIQKIQQDK